jgi:hypothetical protein
MPRPVTEHEIDERDTNCTWCRTCGYLEGQSSQERSTSFCIGEVTDPGKEIHEGQN